MKAPEKLFLPKDICAYDNAVECFVSRTQLHKSDVEYTRSDLCMVWRPIADAPRDGTKIMIYDASWYELPLVAFYKSDAWVSFMTGDRFYPTHFMLIKPPENV